MIDDELLQKLNRFCQRNNLDPSVMYCKECGALLVNETQIRYYRKWSSVPKELQGEILSINAPSFTTTRMYDDKEFRLTRCVDCVSKKYPEVLKCKLIYAMKAAFYTAYAFDVPDEIFRKYTKQRQGITKEKMIEQYGKDEGLCRWNKYCEKLALTNTFTYKQLKYGMSEEEFKKFNQSRACTKDLFILRYGNDEGIRRWDVYCERQKYTTSLDYFIEKYGIDKGTERYKNFVSKRALPIVSNSISKISLDLFVLLAYIYKKHELYYGNTEYTVITKDLSVYRLDYYDKTLNIIIEFYGDYWHLNMAVYLPSELSEFTHKRDFIRLSKIQETLNAKIIVVWEKTYRSNKVQTISRICDIINNMNKNIEEI